jgi:hypothetical protein
MLKYIHDILIVKLNRSGSRGSAVDIQTSYGLDGRGVRVRVQVRARVFHLQVVQTGCEVNPASYSVGTKGSFPRGKELGV